MNVPRRNNGVGGMYREKALKNINDVVRMIVQEFVDECKPLPEGRRVRS